MKSMDIKRVKLRRKLRLSPKHALETFIAPVFNRGQAVQLLLACVVLVLILRTASPEDRDMQASAWANSIEAFAIVLLLWAVYSLATAPFVAEKVDKSRGKWHGKSFIYNEPLLVATLYSDKASTGTVMHFKMPDLELECLALCSVELSPPQMSQYVVPDVLSQARLSSVPDPRSWSKFTVGKKRDAYVYLHVLQPFAVNFSLRIYCHSFESVH